MLNMLAFILDTVSFLVCIQPKLESGEMMCQVKAFLAACGAHVTSFLSDACSPPPKRPV